MVYSRRQAPKKAPRIIFAVLIIWLSGFGYFIGKGKNYVTGLPKADAAIVLTGGAGRLAKGAELLRAGAAERLLISGAHDSVTVEAVRRRHNLSDQVAMCCIQLDRAAHNTVSNARRSRAWIENTSSQRVALITADYHMPRALLLFRALLPERDIIPVATPAKASWLGQFREYNKFLLTWAQVNLGLIT